MPLPRRSSDRLPARNTRAGAELVRGDDIDSGGEPMRVPRSDCVAGRRINHDPASVCARRCERQIDKVGRADRRDGLDLVERIKRTQSWARDGTARIGDTDKLQMPRRPPLLQRMQPSQQRAPYSTGAEQTDARGGISLRVTREYRTHNATSIGFRSLLAICAARSSAA